MDPTVTPIDTPTVRGHANTAPSRRQVLAGVGGAIACAFLPGEAAANVPVPYDWSAMPPMDSRSAFIAWMQKNRGEDPGFLGQRWDRFQALLSHQDLWDKRDERAYLMTPRERFVTKANLDRALECAPGGGQIERIGLTLAAGLPRGWKP